MVGVGELRVPLVRSPAEQADDEAFLRLYGEWAPLTPSEMAVEMEGFDLEGSVLVPRPNLDLVVRVQGPTAWDVFRPAALKPHEGHSATAAPAAGPQDAAKPK